MKRFIKITLCILVMFVCVLTNVNANNPDVDDLSNQMVQENNDSTAIAEPVIVDNNRYDGEYIPDAEDNGFESWLSGTNPKTRGFESKYDRVGTFKIIMGDKKTAYDATKIRVQGWPDYQPHFYVPSLGREIRKTDDIRVTEIVSFAPTQFVTTKTLNGYTQPVDYPAFDTNVDIPAGTYTVERHSVDMAEVSYQGKKYWVSPQYNGGDYQTTYYGYYVDTPSTLSVSSVNGVPIHQKFMPIKESARTGHHTKPKYVTIHNTANEGWGAGALNHANAQMSSNNWTSWHFTVDNKEVYQSIPMNEVAYHAGDGLLAGNGSTIAIEICENADGNYAQAERNAAYLAARILYENGLPSDAIVMHQYWSGKHCARNIIDGTKGSMGWTGFKNLVKQEYDRIALENGIDKVMPDEFKVLFDNAGLVFDNGSATGFTHGDTLQNVKDKMQGSTDLRFEMSVMNNGISVDLSKPVASGQIIKLKINDKEFRFRVILINIGDVNGDGYISSKDYNAIKNHITQYKVLNGEVLQRADVNNDGYISSKDYNAIKNHIMGRKPLF